MKANNKWNRVGKELHHTSLSIEVSFDEDGDWCLYEDEQYYPSGDYAIPAADMVWLLSVNGELATSA